MNNAGCLLGTPLQVSVPRCLAQCIPLPLKAMTLMPHCLPLPCTRHDNRLHHRRRMACSIHKCIACASNCSYKSHVTMCSCFEGKQCVSGAPSIAPKQGRM